MNELIAVKVINGLGVVGLVVEHGFYMIYSWNYCSGHLPKEWSMLDAIDAFNRISQEDIVFTNDY